MTRTPRQRLRLALLRTFARLTRNHLSRLALRPLPPAPRILVIRPDHMGDLLFATPALRILRQHYPDARITALVGPWGASVFLNNPHVDQVVALPFPGFSRQATYTVPLAGDRRKWGRKQTQHAKPSLWQPYGLLRRWARQLYGQYDLAFILRFDHWWGALLAYMAGVPQRVGHTVPEVTPFLSHAVPYIAGRHEVEQNLRLIDWELVNGTPQDEQQPTNSPIYQFPMDHPIEFYSTEQAAAWAKDLLQNGRPVAIHPGAGAAVKLWQAERWAAVADALANETGSKILLTGSETERPLCLEIARRMKTMAWVMTGETTLDQLAALLARCRLVLGLDSGPLHLAVAMGTPTVHLYGPVDRATFGPWGAPERHRVLVSDWPCIPCNRLDYEPDELAHHPCVREIGVDEVLTTVRQVLSFD